MVSYLVECRAPDTKRWIAIGIVGVSDETPVPGQDDTALTPADIMRPVDIIDWIRDHHPALSPYAIQIRQFKRPPGVRMADDDPTGIILAIIE